MKHSFFKSFSALLLSAAIPASASASADFSVSGADASGFLVFLYPALVLLFALLAVADLCMLGSRFGRFVSSLVRARVHGGVAELPRPPEEEFCPTCGEKLVDGECLNGHTIVRCSKCNYILRDGICPHCGVGGEQEFCPTCNSELVDGECPRGHTIVRCPDCGKILIEGVCPTGCNADPLNIGWPGGSDRKTGAFALCVVAPDKFDRFTLPVPNSFIMGRSATDAKEPFVELLTISKKEKSQCSRQYVRMDLGADGATWTVTLLNSSKNPATVDGSRLVVQNATATMKLGSHIKLNPGYELELVETPSAR